MVDSPRPVLPVLAEDDWLGPPPPPAAGLPAVPISPNTCMAAARSLASAAQVYRAQGRMGDAEVCDLLADRLAQAQMRAGWPNPLDPWPGST